MQPTAARMLEHALSPLAPVLPDLVVVGGAAVPMWVDAPGAPPARPTNDTDLIVATRTRVRYHQFGERLRSLGFTEARDSRVICRWVHTATGGIYDVMPLDENILGFANRWYVDAFESAARLTLPGGLEIAVARPHVLVATKLEAFADRGRDDHLASHDIHDIVALVDGCTTLPAEIRHAPLAIREWITERFATMVDSGTVRDAVLNYLPFDAPRGAEERLVELFSDIAGS